VSTDWNLLRPAEYSYLLTFVVARRTRNLPLSMRVGKSSSKCQSSQLGVRQRRILYGLTGCFQCCLRLGFWEGGCQLSHRFCHATLPVTMMGSPAGALRFLGLAIAMHKNPLHPTRLILMAKSNQAAWFRGHGSNCVNMKSNHNPFRY
jgi:hypothetical protein